MTKTEAASRDDETTIRILVVDDHDIFADSVARLLTSQRQLQVVGTAGSVADAVTAASSCRPDVVLMDFSLPDGDGPHATERIMALVPDVKVIMLTGRTDDQAQARAIAAGCAGFVMKGDGVERLIDTIVAVHDGVMVDPTGDGASLRPQLRPRQREVGADLTRRELEILGLMASLPGNKQIAKQLGVSLNTVRNHVRNILSKLQAHSKLEALATAVREDIIGYPT